MSISKKPVRFAHSDGHTDVCYDDAGRLILTGGADGDVRVWDGFDDDDAVSHRAGDHVFCITAKNDKFYTGADDNAIKAFTLPEGQSDGIVTRFTAPVTHMCFNKRGTSLLAGAKDFNIKVVDVDTSSQVMLTGHDAPILSVAYDPKEEFVASSSCDGSVRIWKIEISSSVKIFPGIIPKSNDNSLSKVLCRLSWHPSGKHLAFPKEKEVHVYERDSWKFLFSLSHPDINELVSITVHSPCGRYLAAACIDGRIFIWNTETKTCVSKEKHERGLTISGLAWHPSRPGEIAYTDNEGQMGLLEDCIPKKDDQDVVVNSETDMAGLFDDDDDDMIPDAAGAPGNVDDDDDEDDDDILPTATAKKSKVLQDDESKDSDFLTKDSTLTAAGDADDGESVVSTADRPPVVYKPVYDGPKFAPLQKPFQSGSTPEHLAHRFMVWNSIGIVKQYNTEEETSIEIEFHDTSVHHAMHVTNSLGHTMADISSQAVVLACKHQEETASKLVCMHFSTWDNNREWSVSMPQGEDIQVITIGDGWIAAATDKCHVRLFSVGGLQLQAFSIPGPVVSMAAYEGQLLIAYHSGTGTPGDQCLGYYLMKVQGKKKTSQSGPLPLSPKSTLYWLGFTLEGTPCYADSKGIVRMMHVKFGGSWVQVANMKSHCKGKSDHYWIVGILENPQQLRCIPCKGSMYPPTLPRPAVSVLPFQLPLCELTTDKGQLEESLLRNRLFTGYFDTWDKQGYEVDQAMRSNASLAEQQTLIKLFALACKTEHEFRAIELCERMNTQHTIQLAFKYAGRLRMMQLANRIGEIARRMAQEEEDEEEEEEEVEYVQPVRRKPAGQSSATRGQQEEEEQEEDMMDDDEDAASGPMLKVNGDNRKPEQAPSQTLSQQAATRKNPFKMGSQKATPPSNKGTSVFDNMKPIPLGSRTSNKQGDKGQTEVKVKKKGSLQSKLLTSSKNVKKTEEDENKPTVTEKRPNRSAFQLWFEASKAELAEENPEAEEGELVVMGTRKFKQLSKEEKEEWSKKAKLGDNDNSSPADGKKRKREDEDADVAMDTEKRNKKKIVITEQKKKPLSQSTNSKLAGFVFNKD